MKLKFKDFLLSNRIIRMSWLVERRVRFSILKIGGFLFLVFIVFSCCLASFAFERALFIDATEEKHFYPLFEFLEKFFDEVEFRKDLSFPLEREDLPQDFDVLFQGYQKGSLLFFQFLIPKDSWKVLSMVRPLSEKETMLETLKQRITNFLNIHKSFKILFLRKENERFVLVVRDLKDGKEREINTQPLTFLEDVSISHDGLFAFLVSRRAGYREIWRLELESEKLLPLSCGGYNDFSPYPLGGEGRLVFLSDRNGEEEILVMEPDGALQKKLFEEPKPSGKLRKVVATSQGDKVAISLFEKGRWCIQILDLFSGHKEEIDFPGNALDPVFSADDREIIFVGEQHNDFDLFSFDLIDKSLQRLTFDHFLKAHPTVSPNGEWIAFSGKKVSNNWDIFLFERSSKKLYRLTSSFATEISPLFSPVPIF